MAEVNVTVIGNVGNDPVLKKSKSDLSWTQFRVCSTRKIKDPESGMWVDGTKMWFTVKAWGNKAENVIDSIRKGTPVVVTGRLSEEPYQWTKLNEKGEAVTELRNGLTVENAVVAIDLSRGAAKYFRTEREQPEPAEAPSWARAATVDSDSGEIITPDAWGESHLPALTPELVAA